MLCIVLISLSSLFPVIEVASGEYGDLNPVLFDAVQGGLCSEEGKKNSRDKTDSSCPSQCHSVSDISALTHHTHPVCLVFNIIKPLKVPDLNCSLGKLIKSCFLLSLVFLEFTTFVIVVYLY